MFEACLPDQARRDIRNGVHCEGDEYRLALFLKADALDKDRSATTYSEIGEIAEAGGYTRGGIPVTMELHKFRGETHVFFGDAIWPDATIAADSCVVYNASKSNKVVLSDDDRVRKIEDIEMRRELLHYRFDDCDHAAKTCPFSRGRQK